MILLKLASGAGGRIRGLGYPPPHGVRGPGGRSALRSVIAPLSREGHVNGFSLCALFRWLQSLAATYSSIA